MDMVTELLDLLSGCPCWSSVLFPTKGFLFVQWRKASFWHISADAFDAPTFHMGEKVDIPQRLSDRHVL